jgi:hypothetical protein
MRLAILFWFYKDFDLCVERIALLRRLNPEIPIYGLYGGAPEEADYARRLVGARLDNWWAFEADVDRHWRWLHGDQLIAAWMRERGRDLPWDTVVLAQWDHLFLAPMAQLFGGLGEGEALFSGFRPMDEVRAWWGWAGGRDEERRARLEGFEQVLRTELGYGGPLFCCLFIVACLPRAFLERYAAEAPAEAGFLEYKMPTLAAAWNVPVRTDLGFQPWWAADPATKQAPARNRVLNAVGQEPEPETILAELERPDGARVFHPFGRPLSPELQAAVDRTAAAAGPPRRPRVAVLLRTHVETENVRRSLRLLAEGQGYDAYLLAHEEPGRNLDAGPLPKLSHSLQSIRDLGFHVESPYFLMHCADILFGWAAQQLPDYDFYVMLENDVFLRDGDPPYLDRISEALGQVGAMDLAIVKLGRSDPVWIWHGAVARSYPEVFTSFFPLVVVSKRGAEHLLQERLREQARTPPEHRTPQGTGEDHIMFCEAFIASALWGGGYNILDLNELVPGSYQDEYFNTGPPQLFDDPGLRGAADLVHPVLSDREFLDKHLYYSWRTRSLRSFHDQLKAGAWPLPEALRAEYLERTREKLAEPEAPEWAK